MTFEANDRYATYCEICHDEVLYGDKICPDCRQVADERKEDENKDGRL